MAKSVNPLDAIEMVEARMLSPEQVEDIRRRMDAISNSPLIDTSDIPVVSGGGRRPPVRRGKGRVPPDGGRGKKKNWRQKWVHPREALKARVRKKLVGSGPVGSRPAPEYGVIPAAALQTFLGDTQGAVGLPLNQLSPEDQRALLSILEKGAKQ
jgi:hypothetical protein